MQGKVEGDCFIVLDAFALPVEGTETRVNAQQEAYEYIIDFAETNKVRVLSNTLRLIVCWILLEVLGHERACLEARS